MLLLVSVRNEDEAEQALKGGCDILDIKEPERGSLGGADLETIERIVRSVGGRVAVSVALGELAEVIAAGRVVSAIEGVSYYKAGPAGLRGVAPWSEEWRGVMERGGIPARQWVGVVYADGASAGSPSAEEMVATARDRGCAGVLIDTWEKRGGNLLAHMSLSELQRLRSETRAAGMFLALAGSLRLEDLGIVSEVQPEIVAVRGGVCRGGERTGAIDEGLVRSWKEKLTECSRRSEAGAVVR